MKKIPRNIGADDLIRRLNKFYQYYPTRQTGSHIRITSEINGQHHITIPNHNPIKIGTLSAILNTVAIYVGCSKEHVIEEIF